MTLTDLITERRLLASLMSEPNVLAMADALDEQDFSDPRHRHVLRAIRQLRADGADVGLDEIDHELKLQDMARASGGGAVVNDDGSWVFGAGSVADKAGFWFLAELLIEFAPYRDKRELVEHDVAWLRELSCRRRTLRSTK